MSTKGMRFSFLSPVHLIGSALFRVSIWLICCPDAFMAARQSLFQREVSMLPLPVRAGLLVIPM